MRGASGSLPSQLCCLLPVGRTVAGLRFVLCSAPHVFLSVQATSSHNILNRFEPSHRQEHIKTMKFETIMTKLLCVLTWRVTASGCSSLPDICSSWACLGISLALYQQQPLPDHLLAFPAVSGSPGLCFPPVMLDAALRWPVVTGFSPLGAHLSGVLGPVCNASSVALKLFRAGLRSRDGVVSF